MTRHTRFMIPWLRAAHLSLVSALFAASQAGTPIVDLVRDAYGTAEGLPQSTVRCLAHTGDGYLWAATQSGLARFDGVRFRSFQVRNAPGLPQDNIHVVAAGREGSLWIGTYTRGVVRYRDGVFTPIPGLANPAINAILEDREGRVWIGTNHGLNLWQRGKLSVLTTAEGLAGNAVLALAEDREGALWVATEGGLSLLENGKPQPFSASAMVAGRAVLCLTAARDGSIWLSTGRALLRIENRILARRYEPENLPTKELLTALAEDAGGSLWIGTWGDGLLRLRGNSLEHYGTGEGLSNGTIHCLLAESDGSVWAGTNAGGMNRLRPKHILQIGAPEGLSDTDADAVLEGRDGSVWIATQGRGLNRYLGGSIRTYTTRDGLSSNVILAIGEAGSAGAIWAGTVEGGLNWLEGDRFRHITLGAGIRVAQIVEDRDESMWVGTSAGLYRVERGRPVAAYTTADGLPDNRVFAILRARDGALWLGTSGGFSHFQSGRFTNYGVAAPGSPAVRVISFHEDAEGVLWLGTQGRGLGRMKDGRFSWFGMDQGLNDETVYSVLESDEGDLWISTNRGICRVAKRQLDEVAEGRLRAVTVRVYGRGEGLRSDECYGGTQPSGWRRRSGQLLFACIGGAVVIDPAHLPRAAAALPVHIEEVRANGRTVVWQSGELRVPPGDGDLEFGYTGIDFSAPSQVRFRYRLENVDESWIEAGARRTAYYTKVPPGHYLFRVMAENADGGRDWAQIQFVLQPHYYQTIWFRGASAVLALALLAGAVLWKARLDSKRHLELERTVASRTQEMHLAQREAENRARELQEALRLNQEIIGSAREGIIVYGSDLRYRVWNRFMEELTGMAAGDVLGREPQEVIPSLDAIGVRERLGRVLAGEGPETIDFSFALPNGRSGWVSDLSGPLRNPAGAIVGVIATVRDISERKRAEDERARLEAQFVQVQKMESVGRLAGGVAHDFNNLLTVINGYSGFLLKGLQDGDPLRSYAGEIRAAGERAASLTKQLLAFSRKQLIEPRVFDLNTAIRQAAPMLERLIGEDIELKTHLDESLGQVLADPDQIHQVVMNLVVNARDAMPHGGRLHIETANVEVGAEASTAIRPDTMPGRYVLMTVTDNGQGMDETVRHRIFEPFFTTKEVGKGTGLGLSTAYGIVRQSGGWIDVSSEVGVGTSFRIYLPRTDESPVPEHDGTGAPAAGGSETILVAEDHEAVRSFAAAALRQRGYHVIEASDGNHALAVAARHAGRLHLLLTDVVMPGMNGKELSERLKELRPTLKVLFMSGYTAEAFADRGVFDSGVAFLHKPFSPEELAAKVREMLGAL